MKTPINDCCPTLKFDNTAQDGWRWYDPNDYHDAIVRHFLEDFQNATDKHRHVLRYCHDSISDTQTKTIIKYFANFRIAFDLGIFGNENHMEVLKDLHFEDESGKSRKHKVFFGFDHNNWYNSSRITGIRRMSRNGLIVQKTIFTVDKTINDWCKNRTIFDNK